MFWLESEMSPCVSCIPDIIFNIWRSRQRPFPRVVAFPRAFCWGTCCFFSPCNSVHFSGSTSCFWQETAPSLGQIKLSLFLIGQTLIFSGSLKVKVRILNTLSGLGFLGWIPAWVSPHLNINIWVISSLINPDVVTPSQQLPAHF